MATPTPEGLRDMLYADDDTYQETIGSLCLDSAAEYLRGAGVPDPLEGEEPGALYELACYMLASYWYEHRAEMGTVSGSLSHGISAIVIQLRS